MKAVRQWGEFWIVLIPEARVKLVLPEQEFIAGLKRYKAWSRRWRQLDREAQAAVIAEDKRSRLAGVERSWLGPGGGEGEPDEITSREGGMDG